MLTDSGVNAMSDKQLAAIMEADDAYAGSASYYKLMELLRLALPRHVFTLSQVKYAVDRITWLYENRNLIEGLKFTEEPKMLRFFFGKLEPVSDWQSKLVQRFKEDFGGSL